MQRLYQLGFFLLVLGWGAPGCAHERSVVAVEPGLVSLPALQNTAPPDVAPPEAPRDVVANGIDSCPSTSSDALPGRWPPCPSGAVRMKRAPDRVVFLSPQSPGGEPTPGR